MFFLFNKKKTSCLDGRLPHLEGHFDHVDGHHAKGEAHATIQSLMAIFGPQKLK